VVLEFLYDFGLFLLKSITIVFAIIVVIGVIANSKKSRPSKVKGQPKGEVQLNNLTEAYRDMVHSLQHSLLSKFEAKAIDEAEKKADKAKQKQDKERAKVLKKAAPMADQEGLDPINKKVTEQHKRLFVLDFNGDIQASAVNSLREEITAILAIAGEQDEVLLRLESPGGMVHGYGLAASQLKRLRERNIKLTVAVDKVAASGGYMMACVANKIVAAPFAIIGSIGVIAQIPNFNKVLKKMDVDFEQHTAGKYKRTLTVFGENTDDARDKFKLELEETHELFKDFIKENRSELDVEAVATGEHWFGSQALERNLIDGISTSDDLILDAVKTSEVFEVNYEIPQTLSERLGVGVESTVNRFLLSWWQRNEQDPKY
jgi:serine protease SohB